MQQQKIAALGAFSVWAIVLTLSFSMATSALAIGISFDTTSGGTLEDAILIASVGGAPPRQAVALGDFDLSIAGHVVDIPVDAGMTHWWLIGHESGDVVYSSNQNLLGVDLYAVEPYDVPGAELAWNIPANLDGYVNGTGFSFDWWAQTVNNHASHVAANEDAADLWRFASPGASLGSVAVSLYTNTPPGINPPGGPIPEPATVLLFGLGVLGIISIGHRARKTP
jgi:hypothetical protein